MLSWVFLRAVMAAQIRHSMPPLKQQTDVNTFVTRRYTSAITNTTWAFLMEHELTRFAVLFSSLPPLRVIPSYVSVRTDSVRVMCGDGSPYSTVHQVIPGGHAEETIQGELVREQLENRIAQVRINSGHLSNSNQPRVSKKKKGVDFTL